MRYLISSIPFSGDLACNLFAEELSVEVESLMRMMRQTRLSYDNCHQILPKIMALIWGACHACQIVAMLQVSSRTTDQMPKREHDGHQNALMLKR